MVRMSTEVRAVLFLLFLGAAQARNRNNKTEYEVEDLVCSGGKASYGLSLGVPADEEWADGDSDHAAPFSACLFCSSAAVEDDGGPSQFLQEACTYLGDARRSTLVQKFECVRGEFLRGFSPANSSSSASSSSSLDSMLSCRVPDKESRRRDDSEYQVAFPSVRPGGGRRARQNWRRWQNGLTMGCRGRDDFVCGVRISRNKDNRTPPMLEPMCCDVKYGKNSALAFKDDGILGFGSGNKTAVTVLGVLVIILALALLACVANVWCCRFLPSDCSPPRGGDSDSYESSNGDLRPKSQFGTRPSTVKPHNGNGNNNGVTPPEDVEAGNGEGSRLKRPKTSTIRKGETNGK